MSSIRFAGRALAIAAVVALAFGGWASKAAELPKSTQEMLQKLKVGLEVLDGLDKELAVPEAWITAARKEAAVTVYTTERPQRFEEFIKPFKERYAFLKVDYELVVNNTRRIVRPIMAFKEGRYLTDVVVGLSGNTFLFKDAGAFIRLDDLPAYNTGLEGIHDPDHMAVSFRTRYWCMGYNKSKIKESELPKDWDDLVTNPRFAKKAIGVGNFPNLWLPNLWNAKGEAWTKSFIDKLYGQDPQLRKEGLSAMLALLAVGEFDISLPSADNRVAPWIKKGAPVGYRCLDPVPLSTSEMGIMKGAPHLNAAKLYVNWALSKEGQLAQFVATGASPSHKEMQNEHFLAIPKETVGRKYAYAGDSKVAEAVLRYWNDKWMKGGGPAEAKAKKR